MTGNRTLVVVVGTLAVAAALGPFLPPWALFLLTVALGKGLVVLGLMLMLRAGLVSFGQALFYCLGAYAGGGVGRFFGISDIFLVMLTGGAVAGLIGFLLGFLLARYRAIFFGLLSLAFSMILYGLLVKSEALGSTDGFNVLPSTVFGIRPGDEWVRYVVLMVAAVAAGAAALAVDRLLNTPLGRLLPALKDNEIRVEYMGASARRTNHTIYVIAATLAGVGGALVGAAVGHIDPEMAFWTMSGEFIFIAILAGTGSVLAPFLGAIVFGAIHTVAFDLSPNTWQMALGIALLLVIVFLPEGVWSLFTRRKAA
jgi:branched-chain amino acid transport system permease protein